MILIKRKADRIGINTDGDRDKRKKEMEVAVWINKKEGKRKEGKRKEGER